MKLSRSLIILLLAMVSSSLFSLDIYFNDILWHSYNQEDLESLQIELAKKEIQNSTAIPFMELLPLMSETKGVRISIPSGEIFLTEEISSFRDSKLSAGDQGRWELSLNNSVYYDPQRIELYGTPADQKKYIIWTEPGLSGLDKQIRVWSSLHKVEIELKEVQSIGDELIHRQMTGDLMPDFVLQFQDASLPYDNEKTIAFILQSVILPAEIRKTETLVLPSGQKLHPDLFMSILASLSERVSPYDPGFLKGSEGIRQAADVYMDLILNHKVVEQDDFFLDETYRNQLFGFFPARSFPRQSGIFTALPHLPGMERPLSSRVYPLQFKQNNETLPQGSLLDFLKLPGIQYNLLSVTSRQLPEMTEALEDRDMNGRERDLYEAWKRGYILSDKNHSFRSSLEAYLPDLFRGEGAIFQ